MSVETEVKIRLQEDELELLRELLPRTGATRVIPRNFEENLLFDDSGSRLKETGCALRLRSYAGTCSVTFKGRVEPDRHFKKRPEFQVSVSDPGVMRQIFESVGLRVVFRYDKFREKWRLPAGGGPVEICLDETPVGDFIEIEGEAEPIRRAAGMLDLDEDRFIRENYVDLYLAAGLGEP